MESEHKFMLNDILRKKRKSKMRKPEYPVFLTYGPIHVFPLACCTLCALKKGAGRL